MSKPRVYSRHPQKKKKVSAQKLTQLETNLGSLATSAETDSSKSASGTQLADKCEQLGLAQIKE